MEFLPPKFESTWSVIKGLKVLLGPTPTVAGGITGCSMGLVVLLGVSQQLLLVLGKMVKHIVVFDYYCQNRVKCFFNVILWQIGPNVANLIDKEDIIGGSKANPTNNPTNKYMSQWSSKALLRSSTGEHIYQLIFWGTITRIQSTYLCRSNKKGTP